MRKLSFKSGKLKTLEMMMLQFNIAVPWPLIFWDGESVFLTMFSIKEEWKNIKVFLTNSF